MTKRIFDIFFSFIAILIFAIPMIVIAFVLKIIERHPVIFRQERIGFHRRKFNILKFQTMVDDKATKAGRILRKTGLDELPQFFNVLKGDMSIVGPRALTEYDIFRLNWDSEYYNSRWSIKPGITGLAQIYGGQHKKTSWFWDSKYIEVRRIPVDFSLVMISFMMNIFGKTRIRTMIWKNKGLK